MTASVRQGGAAEAAQRPEARVGAAVPRLRVFGFKLGSTLNLRKPNPFMSEFRLREFRRFHYRKLEIKSNHLYITYHLVSYG